MSPPSFLSPLNTRYTKNSSMQSSVLFKKQPQQTARGNAELSPRRETSASFTSALASAPQDIITQIIF